MSHESDNSDRKRPRRRKGSLGQPDAPTLPFDPILPRQEPEVLPPSSNATNTTTPTTSSQIQFPSLPETPKEVRVVFAVIDALISAFWLYIIVKLFIFDIDIYIVNMFFPEFSWLLDYKIIAFLVIAVLVAYATTKTKWTWLPIFYISLFPFIAVFWKIPKLIFRQKSWVLALATVNSILAFFKSFRRNVVGGSAWIISMIVSVAADNQYVLLLSSTALIVILTLIYLKAFRSVFKPSPVFQAYGKMASKLRNIMETKPASEKSPFSDTPITVLSDAQKKAWASSIEPFVLFNRVCLFLAHKLREYQNSGVSITSGTLRIIFILFISIITFSAVNFALYTFDPAAFEVVGKPRFFTFIFYSVNNFVFNFIRDISPTSTISQAVWILGFLFALLLCTILITLIFSERARRQDDEMKAAIAEIEAEGDAMERFIIQYYGVPNIGKVVEDLEELKSGMLQIILYLTRSIR